ncbi:alpha/beta hydrolase [Actinopolymorpha sp. B11F2]|uniref:alpha/beta hydrolase n=1 Tax=Actinopolymorpha sp. B11F2 TaxID=3160862 RepID=UPI0032E52BB9
MAAPPEVSETIVDSGPVPLAVRDHGGDGPPILLIHGAGGNLLAWEGVAPHLTATHRVVALDLRGHGRSGDGPWSWAAVLDDLELVIERLALDAPAVVGHSMGGMLAAMWARRHHDCPAVVSLDGHRSAETYARNYAGMPPEQVNQDLAALKKLFDTQARQMAQPLTEAMVDMLLEQQRAAALAIGADPDRAAATMKRGLRVDDDGNAWWRPSAATSATLRDLPEFKDCLPVFAEVTSPFLVVLATRILPGVPPQLAPLLDALRAGLRRDLSALAARNPQLRDQEFDASHGMVFEEPAAVAAVVGAFLQGYAPAADPAGKPVEVGDDQG